MPLVIWNDSLNIGIKPIDSQHKQLIDQLNMLVDAMRENRGTEEIKKIVDFLDVYVYQHFNYEEDCMKKYKCRAACQNEADHTKFIATFKEIKQELKQKGTSLSLAIKVNEQLLDWFVEHIKKIDRELKNCLN